MYLYHVELGMDTVECHMFYGVQIYFRSGVQYYFPLTNRVSWHWNHNFINFWCIVCSFIGSSGLHYVGGNAL